MDNIIHSISDIKYSNSIWIEGYRNLETGEIEDWWQMQNPMRTDDPRYFRAKWGGDSYEEVKGAESLESNEIISRMDIGSRIKKLREEAGLTQDQLAEKTGLLKQNISRIESGKYSTGQDILSKIATALGKKLGII